MALRISSAEIVSSAMARPLPCGSVSVEWLGGGARSADELASGDFESVGDAAVDDLVAHLDDQATEHARVHGHLEADGAAVDPAEHLGQPALLRGGQRNGGGDPRDRLPAAAAGHLGEPLDRVLRMTDVRAGQ